MMESYLRWAIWFEHGKKCKICGELTKFNEIHIDHIIPQQFFKDTVKLTKLLKQLELSNKFEKDGLENLIPTHPKCNLIKGNKELPLPLLSLIVSQCEALKNNILATAENYRKQFFWQFNANSPQSPQFQGKSANSNKLNLPVTFQELDNTEYLSFDDLDNIFDLQVQEDWLRNLELTNDKEIVHVNTLREYKTAVLEDYYGQTNFAMKMGNIYSNAIYILDAYKSAQPPLKSYISNPYIGVSDFRYMPPPLTFGEEGYEEEVFVESNSMSEVLEKMHRGVSLLKLSSREYQIWFNENHDGRWMREVARYDFTGSGYEETLAISGYYCEGTLSFSSPLILSKTNTDDMFEILDVPNKFDEDKDYSF